MAISEDGDAIATASVGSEGAIGTIAGTGFVRAFTRAMVLAPGVASQIAVPHFRRVVSKSEAINDLLTRYHMALMCQVQQTSLCNSLHDATARLSRLLLVLSEQGEDDTILFSQERLADMLGLRRSSVTLAAQTLQSRRFIRYRRGRIEIVNRKGLKAAACECYEVVSRTFDQFLEDHEIDAAESIVPRGGSSPRRSLSLHGEGERDTVPLRDRAIEALSGGSPTTASA
jgi:DNA-binding MarR family transcriptional regulator